MTFILPSFGASAISAISAVPASGGGGGALTNTYSLSLDGTDDYARLTGMTLSGAFTASFWFNPLSHAMGTGDLFMTKGYDATPHQQETDWKLDYASGAFRYSIFDRTATWGGSFKIEATHTFSFSANTWYHIMITYDGGTSTSGMGLFVDGVSKTLTTAREDASFTGNNSTSATAVNIGSSSNWSGGKLTGLIDEVAFWETDQSANISSIYTGTTPIDLSGLSTAPNDWFRFENNANNEISGGSGSASLQNGPTFVQGYPSIPAAYSNNYSLSFDDSDDALTLASPISFTGEFTISAWVKPNQSGLGIPVGQYSSGNFVVRLSNSQFSFWANGSDKVYAGGSYPNNSWYHLFIVRDSSDLITFYINGSSDGSFTKSGTLTTSGLVSSTFDYGGLSDEYAMWDSDQSSNLSAIYNSGVPADLSSYSPVGWWRMGENDGGTGTTITDQGSGGNDATFTNSPTFSTTVPS